MDTYDDPAGTRLRVRTHPREPAGLQVRATPALRNPTLVALPPDYDEAASTELIPPLPGTTEPLPPEPRVLTEPVVVTHSEARLVVALIGMLMGITVVLVAGIILLVTTA